MRVKKRYILIKRNKNKKANLTHNHNNRVDRDKEIDKHIPNDKRIRVVSQGKTTRTIAKIDNTSNLGAKKEHLVISCKLENLKDVILLLNHNGIEVVNVSGSMKSIRSRFNSISSRSA